jgi:hypothetical protein
VGNLTVKSFLRDARGLGGPDQWARTYLARTVLFVGLSGLMTALAAAILAIPVVYAFLTEVNLAEVSVGMLAALVALVGAAIRLVVLIFSPHAPCSWCKSSQRQYGGTYVHAFDLCRHCGGRGRRLRWGASRLFRLHRYRD